MGVRWGRGVNTLGRDCAGWEAISAPARDGRVDVGGGVWLGAGRVIYGECEGSLAANPITGLSYIYPISSSFPPSQFNHDRI